ncbi:MAG: hypothetical protein LBT10_00070, partial [Methanobrevibacter sp.]|nr:hypothetical protein [Methanobrevibacter sp.]
MLFKRSLLILVLIGLLCLIGSVSSINFPLDNGYDNRNIISSSAPDFSFLKSIINVRSNSLSSSLGSDFSLEDAVRDSKDNDIINITNNPSTVNNIININHNLTIEGNGLTTLDLNTTNGLFIVDENCTLYLSNIRVSDEYLSSSLIRNNGELILNNCLFENNKGRVNGLIINNVFKSSVSVNNSSFINNNANDASKGGVINMDYSNGVNNISNSVLVGNHAYLGGALYTNLYDNGLLNIVNCTFENNTGSKGGAIYNKDSHLILKDNVFGGNEADLTSSCGGAIFNDNSDDLEILDCDFHDNNALCGGAVYATTAVNSVSHSNFTNNHALSGGAIYNKDGNKKTYVYNRTQFIGNGQDSKGSYGGAITINNGDLVLTRSILNNNTAEIGGAVYVDSGYDSRIIDCLFNDNYLRTNNNYLRTNNERSYGGAIYSKNSSILIRGTVFNHSIAYNGGGIYADGGLITVDDDEYKTMFINNIADKYGAGIFTLGDLKVSGGDEMVDFIGNNAGFDGGAIYTSSKSNLYIMKTCFQSNNANGEGGAIRSRGLVHDGPNIKILSSEFNNNTADKGAGVFLYEGSNAV